MATADWTGAIARATQHAPFLARALERQGELAALLRAGAGEAALDWARTQGDCADAGIGLRRQRLALAAALAIGDLAGAFPLARVMAELSGFADYALDTAIAAVGSALWDELFSPKAQAPVAAVSCYNPDLPFIYKHSVCIA